ncbi:hypothetical protein [Streptomyces sp. 35G-GA-8]|uniref:hypothetical protein n=1 Tax=Streptomyces sp. 35G-GA-8 TaxID=2939434 RepID=UPI00201EEEE0|nr:hypothetical protein [Streptomyces sp. 35G-GA-8]MCL7380705.1 hypothetical protein [Streptomyces sp. 35G-GA-8]
MQLRFVGIDPDTGTSNSPTVWVREAAEELVFQGWKADAELEGECAAFHVPGHAVGIPSDETVVRIPFRMIPILREACDAAERAAQLRGADDGGDTHSCASGDA